MPDPKDPRNAVTEEQKIFRYIFKAVKEEKFNIKLDEDDLIMK